MVNIEIKFEGLSEFSNRLKDLSKNVRAKILRAAGGAAARVIAKEAKLRAPMAQVAHFKKSGVKVEPGALKRSISAVRSRRNSKDGFESWSVIARSGKKYGKLDAYYAAWVEMGHFARPPQGIKKGSKSTKFIAPCPFLRPAFDAKKQDAITKMANKIKIGLEKL